MKQLKRISNIILILCGLIILSGSCGPCDSSSANCPPDHPCTHISKTPVLLNVTPTGQICQEWCWAATVTMVANYYGNGVPLCKAPTDKQWQTRGQYGVNCCSFASCSSQCNQTATSEQMRWHLSNEGIYSYLIYQKLSETELQLELSEQRPVIIGYLSSFSGHVVVVMGFAPGSPNIYRVVDPFYGVFDVTYDQLCCKYQGGSSYWGVTLYRLAKTAVPAPTACTP